MKYPNCCVAFPAPSVAAEQGLYLAPMGATGTTDGSSGMCLLLRNLLSLASSYMRWDGSAEGAEDAHWWFPDIQEPAARAGCEGQSREHRACMLAAGRRCSWPAVPGISIFSNLMSFGDLFMPSVVKNWKRPGERHGLEMQHLIEATTELLSEAPRKASSSECQAEPFYYSVNMTREAGMCLQLGRAAVRSTGTREDKWRSSSALYSHCRCPPAFSRVSVGEALLTHRTAKAKLPHCQHSLKCEGGSTQGSSSFCSIT